MGKIVVEKISCEHYGECVRISNGEKEVVATLERGPYIVRCAYVGEKNMFFEDFENKYTNDVTNSPFKGNTWRVVGGHRLWLSPERHPRTYYPDDYAVECEIKENGVILTAPEQEWTNMQYTTEIEMTEDGDVKIKHTVTNTGAWAVKVAPWTVSVMQTGGLAVIPQNVCDTGFFPNKWVNFWQYTPMNDERIYLGEKFVTLSQDCDCDRAAKIGVLNEHGYMIYFVNGCAFVKKFGFVRGAEYPDNGCNCESYTCDGYTEMECLSPFVTIDAGDVAVHEEEWSLVRADEVSACDEAALSAAVAKIAE
ncbi:MAG: hypothetical protein LUG52_08450 [Clostridia bacterium]|nr:hypothetical protein [Clostridia bacterium]